MFSSILQSFIPARVRVGPGAYPVQPKAQCWGTALIACQAITGSCAMSNLEMLINQGACPWQETGVPGGEHAPKHSLVHRSDRIPTPKPRAVGQQHYLLSHSAST